MGNYIKQCTVQDSHSLSLLCGEDYTINIREAAMAYNVDCSEHSNGNSTCRNDATSLFQSTCDGYSSCRIQWSAVDCLEYRCMEQPVNSIEVNFTCKKSMFSLSEIKIL